MTRIAVSTDDNATVSGHFGRCSAFLIFSATAEGEIVREEIRKNGQTPHAMGLCHGGEGGHGGAHSHDGIAGALADCQVLLTGGMGWRAAADLQGRGIRAHLAPLGEKAEDAVKMYLAGTLTPATEGACCCHHH